MKIKASLSGFFSLIFSLFLIHFNAIGQKTAALRIDAIPYPLNWENAPLKFTAKGNKVTIVAGEKTDMFRDPNVTYNTDNAPKLLFHADDNFVLIVSIEHGFKNKWDGGAIIIRQDSLNWVKFCFEKDYTGARRVVSVVTKNISDDCNSVMMNSNKVFYKMAKAGNVITLYCSANGDIWYLVRHFQFDTTGSFQVGFMAQSPTGRQNEVTFSDIVYKSIAIKDPYLGE